MSAGVVGGEADEDRETFSGDLPILMFSYAVLALSFSKSLIRSE